MSLLFIGAHPDDRELGCGGPICYFVERKPELEIICYHTTSGVYSDINVQIIREFLKGNNILSIGRYGSWEYSGMEDAIAYGKEVTDFIINR